MLLLSCAIYIVTTSQASESCQQVSVSDRSVQVCQHEAKNLTHLHCCSARGNIWARTHTYIYVYTCRHASVYAWGFAGGNPSSTAVEPWKGISRSSKGGGLESSTVQVIRGTATECSRLVRKLDEWSCRGPCSRDKPQMVSRFELLGFVCRGKIHI